MDLIVQQLTDLQSTVSVDKDYIQSIPAILDTWNIILRAVKSAMDVYHTDGSFPNLQRTQVDHMKQISQLLCDQYGCYGIETVFMMVNKTNSSVAYQGSQKGVDFMKSRADILDDFVKFATDDVTKQQVDQPKTDQDTQHNTYLSNKRTNALLPRRVIGDFNAFESYNCRPFDLDQPKSTPHEDTVKTSNTYETCVVRAGVMIKEQSIEHEHDEGGMRQCLGSVDQLDVLVKQEDTHDEYTETTENNEEQSDYFVKPEDEHNGETFFVCENTFSSMEQADSLARKDHEELLFVGDLSGFSSLLSTEIKVKSSEHAKEKRHKCSLCHYSTERLSNLKRHKLKHSTEKHFQCDICPFRTHRTDVLTNHKRTHLRETHRCDQCDFTTQLPRNLAAHKEKHAREKLRKCEFCEYTTYKLWQLNRHSKTHCIEKTLKCEWCNYSTKWPSNLVSHRRTHTKEKPYKCSYCEFCAQTSTILKRHIRVVHTGETPYKCDACDFSTVRGCVMKAHKLKHAGERPFLCDLCGFGALNSHQLKEHKMRHAGEKPFVCEVCGFSTNRAHRLKLHKRIHTGEKPYTCDLCGYSAIQSCQVKNHKKLRHSGEISLDGVIDKTDVAGHSAEDHVNDSVDITYVTGFSVENHLNDN